MFELSPAECQQLLAQMELTAEGQVTWREFLASLLDWHTVSEGVAGQGCSELAAGPGTRARPPAAAAGRRPAAAAPALRALPSPPRLPTCLPVSHPVQLQESSEWEVLVDRAFDAMGGCECRPALFSPA